MQNGCPKWGTADHVSHTSQDSQINYAGEVSKMRVSGVQNGGARFAGVESEKS